MGIRFPLSFYLIGGYKYVKTSREDVGETDPAAVLPFNRDNIYSVELKWSGLDFMDARVGYEKFDRDAQYRTSESAVAPDRKFSYGAQNRNSYKATLDIFPLENLNLGFEYVYRNTDYTDTTYGLLKDTRHELNISADYRVGKIAKLYAYADYEFMRFDQLQNVTGVGTAEVKPKDKGYGYGVGAEVYVIPKTLTLIFQHDYLKSNGSVDFTYNDSALFANAGIAGANNDTIDIFNWDDYTLYSFTTKAVYNFTKSLTAFIGYGYERFKYSDAQLNSYQYVPATAGTNGAYLTGAYKDQSYSAHLVFAGVTYKF